MPIVGARVKRLNDALINRLPHGHEELDRQIGPENIPLELRVKPVTGPYIET